MSRRIGASNECYADYNHNYKDNKVQETQIKHKGYWQRRSKSVFRATESTEEKGGSIRQATEKEMPNLWQTAMSTHIDTRRKIKEIADISSFNELLDKTLLSEEEKSLLKLHYIQSKDFRYIGDMLGYSESTIKKKHKRILAKLSRML